MFKRLLAFMIVGCLMLDAPATAYAASPYVGTVMTDSTEETAEISGESTGNNLEQEMVGKEDSGENKEEEEPREDAPEAEEDSAEETADEETDEGGQGETITEEITSNKETTGNITDAETEEGISEEQTEEEGIEESAEPETESGTGEELLLEAESEIYIDTASEEVTALQFGETNTIILAGRESNNGYIYQWYSFTAPEAGYYILNTGIYVSGNIGLYASVDGDAIRYLADRGLRTDFMEAGETVYFCAYTSSSSDVTVDLTLQKLAMFSAAEQEDGSYSFETEDYTLSILPEAGYGNLRVKASIEAKEGKTLESSYVLVSYYQKKGSSEIYSSQSLARYQDYQAEYSLPADRESEYSLYFILRDTSYRVLGLFDGDIILKTKQTDEAIVIFDTEATESSITFDMETVQYISYCYYAPTDGSAEEKSLYIGSGWKNYSFTGLQPETEYYFQFVDSSGKTVFETKASTAEAVTKAVYSVVANADNGQPVLKADISGYTGSATSAYLYYEYTNALGEKKRDYVSKSLSVTDSEESAGKSAVIEKTFTFSRDVLEAETQYDITVWVQIGDLSLPKKVETMTTPKASIDAEKLTFTIEQDGTGAKYTIEADGIENTVSGTLYYKQHGAKGSYVPKSVSLSNTNTSATGNISGLQSGTAYDFVLLIDGVKKELTKTFGEANVKLTQIGEGEVNAFDIVRAYKLESEIELAESYSLALYYWNESSSNYYSIGNSVSLSAENEYQAEIKTASSSFKFVADTDYDLKWELKNGSDVIYTFYETIHTKEVNLTWEIEESSYCVQKYRVALDSKDVANFESFSLSLYGYIRKVDSVNYPHQSSGSVNLSSYNAYSGTIQLSGLEPSTSYEVFLRTSDGIEYAVNTFTTPEDTRQLSVISTNTGLHTATISYSLDGFTSSMSGYVLCYMREKGTEDEWEKVTSRYYSNVSGSTTFTLYISSYNSAELKDNTAYEYQIGLGEYSTALSKLEKTITGEFSTAEDKRILSSVGVSASYTTADVSAVFSGNDYGIYSYLYFFYKEKGAPNWIKVSNSTSSGSYNYSKKLTGLKSDTVYEYAMVISDDYNCSSPEEVTKDSRKVVGEFTTKKSGYTLEFAVDDSKTTNSRAVVLVSAKNSAEDARLKVELTLSDGQKQSITLKQAEDYKKEVSFTNLIGNEEYTITKAVLSALENSSYTVIDEMSCDYKFTTKKAEVPTSITLSEEKITLNAAYAGILYEGYSGKTLKAVAAPTTAAADFIWTSSNEAVATVDNGQVCAQGIGTTTITVASTYDLNVKATCEVTVKDYVIGYIENGDIQIFDSYYAGCTLYKNSYVEGFGLYERDADGADDSLTPISGYTVTPVRSGIILWENGKLYALAAGTTVMNFEKDGFKARITVSVTAEGKGFGITAFTSSTDSYPAVKEADGSYTLACTEGISYAAVGEISPKQPFDVGDFKWSISDESIAEVSSTGVITPKKAGTVKLMVAPLSHYTINDRPYINEEVAVTLNIKSLPTQEAHEPIYALANVDTKIGDVDFPESWGKGWSWKYPDTPLVTNGVYSDNQYPFEAVYSGAESYPDETTVSIYIGKITGATVSEIISGGVGTVHNQVLEVGETDALTLRVTPVYQGKITAASYDVEIPAINGLTITKNTDGSYEIKAQKKGSYTLKPVIKAKGTETVLAKTTYKIKAVEEKQAGSITFTTDTEGVILSGNTVIFETEEAKQDFTLNAVVKDRYGEEIATALTWKTTDKTVAAVAAVSKSDTHSAKVTVKGEGHTVITATAKDTAGIWAEVDVEIQDHTPRVDTEKAAVNVAYDYEGSYGKQFASAAGTVEIVPVYGESLAGVQLRDQNGEKAVENLKIEQYSGYRYLVQPSSENLKAGIYNCTIYVKTNVGGEYTYPLKVTVTDKSPTVSVKTKTKVNLFFTNTTGRIDVSISGGTKLSTSNVESVTWEDVSESVNNGFAMNGGYYDSTKKTDYISVSQQSGLKVVNGSLTDAGVAKGVLTIKLRGYKKLYRFENLTVGYEYKKPALVTKNTSSNIAPSVGLYGSAFYMYDKTNKRYLYFGEQYSVQFFDEILCSSEGVTLVPNTSSALVNYSYSGKESSKKITLTLDSLTWREPLTATHTIKAVKPTAYLSYGQLTFNTALKSTGYTSIYLKNTWYSISYTDIVIKGANVKAQKLLDDDLFVITASGNRIQVSQSQADLMDASIPAGTYSYKVTPYYTNPETGEKTALNTMTLKVKVINKPVTAKVSPSGNLDLTYGAGYNITEKKNIAVLVDPKFTNLASGYSLNTSACRLTGEYSEYFQLSYGYIKYNNKYGYHYYLTIKNNTTTNITRKLKAGQSYKLAIEYTLTNDDGESLKVTSNTFIIKPKQTVAKVTVTNNDQTLYAGADNLTRSYSLSVPAYYSIESASGSIDCNKDGKADITVSGAGSLTVRIADKDAVGATTKGKSYSIPVTVKLRGRDGISKDVKITIKVKVKR